MKEILLFVMEGCPHCDLAMQYQAALLSQRPQWRDIPLRIVDETVETDFANGFDYYYVPTYYVGEEKVHEGHAEPADVERVFRLAAGEE